MVVFIPSQSEKKLRRCCLHLVQVHSFSQSMHQSCSTTITDTLEMPGTDPSPQRGQAAGQTQSQSTWCEWPTVSRLCYLHKSITKKSNRSVVRVFYIFQGLRCLVPFNQQLYQAVIITLICQIRKLRLREVSGFAGDEAACDVGAWI